MKIEMSIEQALRFIRHALEIDNVPGAMGLLNDLIAHLERVSAAEAEPAPAPGAAEKEGQ